MSSKNALQEIYQKQGLGVPKYVTERSGGAAHAPIYTSTVTLPTGTKYTATGSNVKDAEKAAASAALAMLRSAEAQSSAVPDPRQEPVNGLSDPRSILNDAKAPAKQPEPHPVVLTSSTASVVAAATTLAAVSTDVLICDSSESERWVEIAMSARSQGCAYYPCREVNDVETRIINFTMTVMKVMGWGVRVIVAGNERFTWVLAEKLSKKIHHAATSADLEKLLTK